MFKDVAPQLVCLSTHGATLQSIPEHYGVYYDYALGVYRRLTHVSGVNAGGEIPPAHWPLVLILADQQKQIDELKAELADREPVKRGPGRPRKTPQPETASVGG